MQIKLKDIIEIEDIEEVARLGGIENVEKSNLTGKFKVIALTNNRKNIMIELEPVNRNDKYFYYLNVHKNNDIVSVELREDRIKKEGEPYETSFPKMVKAGVSEFTLDQN